MAQLVARVVWDHQAAGSNPVTRTISVLDRGYNDQVRRFSIFTDLMAFYGSDSVFVHDIISLEKLNLLRIVF